ncbi:hypothetical protein FNO01nite_31120 [Flavobacterium noncentrifugens]|nr:hypothetical protein FNO01nite_31120 [Flavobacterium noncentrifugens]
MAALGAASEESDEQETIDKAKAKTIATGKIALRRVVFITNRYKFKVDCGANFFSIDFKNVVVFCYTNITQ